MHGHIGIAEHLPGDQDQIRLLRANNVVRLHRTDLMEPTAAVMMSDRVVRKRAQSQSGQRP